ncbi:hypothetical protein [Enterococcus sp. BWR-S5]|uniref:hypothetical protein n=1 Tax=Enterococcus sp. BWR-S5 TaxID=2787714 RepID=UPI001920EA75|nr:hypothetical protein [Enterococcus sp. BWR-S5]MBL1224617.1 hypothetical protein [Enterococcus sp. BWR-S5]
MQWIILVGNENLTIQEIKKKDYYNCKQVTQLENDRVVVDYGAEHVFFDFLDNLIEDYEKEELELLPFKNPHFIMMTFTSKKILKQVLMQNNFPTNLYVDDDDGMIMKMDKYIRLLNENKDNPRGKFK